MSEQDETDQAGEESNTTDKDADAVRKGFAALPFEQKIATLLRVELDMVGEAVETIVSAASRVADEIADAVSGSKAPEPGAASEEATSV